MGWTGALTPAMHRIRPPPASQGEWDEISTLARPHSAKLAVRPATCQTKQVTQQSTCQRTAHGVYLLPASTAACLTGKAG